MGYGTEGPIPWLAMDRWAVVHELEEDQREDLMFYLPRMDEAYLKFKAEKLKATLPKGK